MTQEDKQLLLKDLCARLAYRDTKCYNRNTEEDFTLSDVSDTDTDCPIFDYGYCDIEYIQPYLRPMSSMTEEEKTQYNIIKCSICLDDVDDYIGFIDWLNERYLDYRGLIEKGLALEAPEGMYKF